MFVVIFEVTPKEGQADTYFDMAAELKPLLLEQPGFLSVERYQSLMDSKKFLSISAWEDEESLLGWRRNIEHLAAQETGKTTVFQKYRIRIASVIRDYDFTADNAD